MKAYRTIVLDGKKLDLEIELSVDIRLADPQRMERVREVKRLSARKRLGYAPWDDIPPRGRPRK